METSPLSPCHIPADGPVLRVFEDRVRVALYGEATGGSHAMIYDETPPGGGTPPHVHTRESETFYILEGEFEFWVDGETVLAGPGDTVYAPQNVPHCFRVCGEGLGKSLVVIQPPGFEKMFAEANSLFENTQNPDLDAFVELLGRYGCHLVSPAL